MFKKILIILAVFTLSSCAAAQKALIIAGEVNDTALQKSEKAKAWLALCVKNGEVAPILFSDKL